MGERFGNYELLEKVAVGGMAEIFRARSMHGQGVQKVVCIKRIHPALSSDGVFVEMFIEEARLGVSMVHGNIVPVFDFGYVDGHYYLAMEWVEGLDLATLNGRARIVGMPWPTELAVHVVVEVLEGLAYAHQKRDDQGRPLELVHRDVSPSNILVSLDGQVKLLDFGIARSEAREWQTRTGVVKGKPGYMAPEQACGAEVDARADVWSCGAVLYELLSGVRLRDERRPLADPDLDAIVRRAIDAIPKNRHGSARELQAELMNVLDARHTRPRPRDLAEFIERVRGATAPGTNWDMRSSAVEQHLAAALEAAKRDSADPAFREETPPATVLIAEGDGNKTKGPRTVVLEEPSRPKPRVRPRFIALAALAALAAASLVFWLVAPDDLGSTARTTDRPSAVADRAADAGAGAAPRVSLRPTPPDGGELADAAPGAPAVEPKTPPHPKDDRVRTPPVASRKALLSVNVYPSWAEVTLDRQPIGKTPIVMRGISPGKHVLVLTNPVSGAARAIEFTVKAGDHKTVSEKL